MKRSPIRNIANQRPDEARSLIVDSIRTNDGNLELVGKHFGISSRTIYRLIKKLDVFRYWAEHQLHDLKRKDHDSQD